MPRYIVLFGTHIVPSFPGRHRARESVIWIGQLQLQLGMPVRQMILSQLPRLVWSILTYDIHDQKQSTEEGALKFLGLGLLINLISIHRWRSGVAGGSTNLN